MPLPVPTSKAPSPKKGTGDKAVKPRFLQSVRGMHDILPKDEMWWRAVAQAGQTVADLHDFHFIETPILEPAALFEAGIGATTDIVEKEMYVFKTKGGDRVALRPEGTAPVIRSYHENHLGYYALPLKVFYSGPMFRYEKPQKGRERQFHQWGLEILGDADPVYDAQIILAAIHFLEELKIKEVKLKLGTIGCRVCRPTYREKLRTYYASRRAKLCKDCARRFEKNPLRLLDCKEEQCQPLKKDAPLILDYLCQSCNNNFKGVLELIEDNNILYELDPHLVRGLDYYSRTVFELYSGALPGLALGGGGRYDYLTDILGGRPLPAVGASFGVERVIEAMRAQGTSPKLRERPRVFFAAVGDQAKKGSIAFMHELRKSAISVSESLGKKSLKAQLKTADKIGAPLALIMGQQEVFEGAIIIRDMLSGAQESVLSGKLVEEVKKRLRKSS